MHSKSSAKLTISEQKDCIEVMSSGNNDNTATQDCIDFDSDDYYNSMVGLILIIVSWYKIILEIVQFYGGQKKLTKPWKFWNNHYIWDIKNWLELVGTIFIIHNCSAASVSYMNTDEEEHVTTYYDFTRDWSFWYYQSASAIIIWTRFIFFLRSSESIAYLVRMLLEVVKDMIPFMMVLLLSVFGFADAFLSI